MFYIHVCFGNVDYIRLWPGNDDQHINSGPHQSNSMIRSSSCRWQEKDQHIEEVGYHHFLRSWSDHDPDLIWLDQDLVIARSPVPINMIMLTFMMITWWWWCCCCCCCEYDEEETPPPLPCECESGSEGYRWAEHNPSVLGFGRRMILRVFFWACYCRSSSLTPSIAHEKSCVSIRLSRHPDIMMRHRAHWFSCFHAFLINPFNSSDSIDL